MEIYCLFECRFVCFSILMADLEKNDENISFTLCMSPLDWDSGHWQEILICLGKRLISRKKNVILT